MSYHQRYVLEEKVLLKTYDEMLEVYPETLDEEGDPMIEIHHEGHVVWKQDAYRLGKIVELVEYYGLSNDYWVMSDGGFEVSNFMIKRPINKYQDPEYYL